MPVLTAQSIKQQALALGFHKVGIAAVTPAIENPSVDVPPTAEPRFTARLRHWLAQGYHASMDWMADPRRQNIRLVMPGVQSVISVAVNYATPVVHREDAQVAKLSRYGWGRDYHKVLTRKLKALSTWIQAQEPESQTRYYVDTGPIQERAWAQRAGLGWIGKHSNLITRDYGSWVFLGEVLTSVALPPDAPHTDHCGTCTRCIEACPTQAIREPFFVDANRCIAYHTIENRAEVIPQAIASRLHNWVAGCDICQDVCPWNQRFAQETNISDFQPYPWNIAPALKTLATETEADWDQRFRSSALRRIRPDMMQRNARAALHDCEPTDSDSHWR